MHECRSRKLRVFWEAIFWTWWVAGLRGHVHHCHTGLTRTTHTHFGFCYNRKLTQKKKSDTTEASSRSYCNESKRNWSRHWPVPAGQNFRRSILCPENRSRFLCTARLTIFVRRRLTYLRVSESYNGVSKLTNGAVQSKRQKGILGQASVWPLPAWAAPNAGIVGLNINGRRLTETGRVSLPETRARDLEFSLNFQNSNVVGSHQDASELRFLEHYIHDSCWLHSVLTAMNSAVRRNITENRQFCSHYGPTALWSFLEQ